MKTIRSATALAMVFVVLSAGLTGCCSRRGGRTVASTTPGPITIIRGGATGERYTPPPEPPVRTTRALPLPPPPAPDYVAPAPAPVRVAIPTPPPAPDFVVAAPPVPPVPVPTRVTVSVPPPPPLTPAPAPTPLVRELPPAIDYRPAPAPAALPDISRELYGMVPDEQALARHTVYFALNSSIVSAGEMTKVRDVANYLRAWPMTKVVVDGHCDERGTEEYNRALGDRRALSIRAALAQSGVAAERIFTRSYGKDRPAADGHNEAAWARNRRGEFILLRLRSESRAP